MNEYFAEFVTLVVQAAVAVGLPIILTLVIKWINGRVQLVANELTEDQRRMIIGMLRTVVKAAEQSGLSGELARLGLSKKEYAVKEASSWLESVGLPVDIASISAQIEAIVLEFSTRGWDKPETYDRYW